MNCAEFEDELARVLAGEPEPVDRGACIVRLRAHAAGCSSCAGTADVVELLDLPPGRRDLVSDPGPAYWSEFDGRLDRRLAAAAAERRVSHRGRAAVAAAALLVALAGTWIWTLRPDHGGGGDEAGPTVSAQSGPPGSLEALEVDLEVVEDVWGLGEPETWGGQDGLFPDPGDMDAEARRELLSWLEAQAS